MEEPNQELRELLIELKGIDVAKYDKVFLKKSIETRMRGISCPTIDSYLNILKTDLIEFQRFEQSLQINFSTFFRNPLTFSVLEKIILPALDLKIRNKLINEIRIWSAACAGGQEVYSIAMLINELNDMTEHSLKFRIFATDQSSDQILKASQGIYMSSTLGNLTLTRINNWFTAEGDVYKVKPTLKDSIEFSVFDLLDSTRAVPSTCIFGDFDLVILSNLLFYYKPELQHKIIEKAKNAMAKNGFLITGETEREILMKNDFREIYPQSGIFQTD
jgi:chemotaxis methyl-accepting protein methylase